MKIIKKNWKNKNRFPKEFVYFLVRIWWPDIIKKSKYRFWILISLTISRIFRTIEMYNERCRKHHCPLSGCGRSKRYLKWATCTIWRVFTSSCLCRTKRALKLVQFRASLNHVHNHVSLNRGPSTIWKPIKMCVNASHAFVFYKGLKERFVWTWHGVSA